MKSMRSKNKKGSIRGAFAYSAGDNRKSPSVAEEKQFFSGISLEKRYELIREQIRHEDSLINQRLTWLLLSQGFLFAALTSVSYDLLTSTNALYFLAVIPLTGLALNVISFLGLNEAYKSLKYLRNNWEAARPHEENREGQALFDSFPQITWKGTAITTASGSPMVITFAWGTVVEWMLYTVRSANPWVILIMAAVAAICMYLMIWMKRETNKSMR